MPAELRVVAFDDVPEVVPGADVGALAAAAAERSGRAIERGDIVVVAQKVVSKAEGAIVRLADLVPSPRAIEWAREWNKDPRVVEVVLRESKRIVRMERGVLISETHHGFVCANAGVDASNVADGCVTVLPRDPDRSAREIRASIVARLSAARGRDHRVALGAAGARAANSRAVALEGAIYREALDDAIHRDALDGAISRAADDDVAAVRATDDMPVAAAEAADVGVIVSDTFGRPWREGVVNVALGVDGLSPLVDYRGRRDDYGRELTSTVMAIADEIASAAELVMGKTTRRPIAIVRGAAEWLGRGSGRDLLRDSSRDLFR